MKGEYSQWYCNRALRRQMVAMLVASTEQCVDLSNCSVVPYESAILKEKEVTVLDLNMQPADPTVS